MTKLLADNESTSEDVLLCPICGDDFLHIEYVDVSTDKMVTRIDNKGTSTTYNQPRIDRTKNNRGAIIRIGVWCENGQHRGHIELAFRKGNTFVSSEMSESADGSDIWRD